MPCSKRSLFRSFMSFLKMNKILEKFKADERYEFYDSRVKEKRGFSARYPVGESVRLRSVEVFEHSGNSATYEG